VTSSSRINHRFPRYQHQYGDTFTGYKICSNHGLSESGGSHQRAIVVLRKRIDRIVLPLTQGPNKVGMNHVPKSPLVVQIDLAVTFAQVGHSRTLASARQAQRIVILLAKPQEARGSLCVNPLMYTLF
jgi:hypothetical protein